MEFKDADLVAMPRIFRDRANEINLTCKQHLRTCEQLAKRLAMEKPKTQQEFEKIEFYKDFVIKSSRMNEQVLGLLDYTCNLLNAIAGNSELLAGLKASDSLRMQSDTIEILTEQREKLIKEIYDIRRDQIAAK